MIRMPDGKRWPPNYKGSKNQELFESEGALLGAFVGKVDIIDPDVIVAHDLYSRVMGLLLNRL